jgi:predicted nuclease of predicted toxin-antitoxin system
MLRLASDADIYGEVVRGLRRREPALDIVRVQDVGLGTAEDAVILEWSTSQGRILISRDRKTLVRAAYERVKAGLP